MRSVFRAAISVACAMCAATAGGAVADEQESVAPSRNVFVSMRDGTRLATDIYLPARKSGEKVPVVLVRTPYGKDFKFAPLYDDPKSVLTFFLEHGYVVVVQDTRGRFNSEGSYVASGGDAEDGYDTVDWLSRQEWSNGRVGAYGCSYEGDVQVFMAGLRHPALKALIPQASGSAVGSLGGNYRYFGGRAGGAIEWAQSLGWFAKNGMKVFPRLPADLPQNIYNANASAWSLSKRGVPLDFWRAAWHLPMRDALRSQGLAPTDFEDNVARKPTDEYWRSLPYMTPAYVSDVPALFINSWFDFGADMTLLEFNHFRKHSVSQSARDHQYAIMSPHTHCAFETGATEQTRVGDLDVGDTRFDYRDAYLTWFDAWLKQDAAALRRVQQWPQVRYYAMGRNRWQSASGWPLPGTMEKELFLSSRGRANSLYGDGELRQSAVMTGDTTDSFIYDPANPVASRGGAMCCTGTADAQAGAIDQRPIEARNDVLVYTSSPLERDMEVTGQPKVIVHVSSDAVDTDFTAKLIDVHPDGRAYNLLEGILRARYRNGQEQEVWMKPGEVYEVTIPFGAISNVFRRGHRIRLEISSSNFPRFDRNLNVGGNNAEQVTWQVARNSVRHGSRFRSRLVLPVAGDAER